MKKKILSITLVVCLLATALVSGTLAYFTDSEKATNTMAIGDVEINIEERTFVFNNETEDLYDGTWKEFEDGLTLFPVKTDDYAARVATGQMWNKCVTTFNESKSGKPAYIRTIIAVEHVDSKCGYGAAVGVGFGTCAYNAIPLLVEIGEGDTAKKYDVYVCTDKNGKAYDVVNTDKNNGFVSLQSVWLYDGVTQEEVANVGDLEIEVFSQGIQAAGLTHEQAMEALGEVDEDYVKSLFDGTLTFDDAVINDIF